MKLLVGLMLLTIMSTEGFSGYHLSRFSQAKTRSEGASRSVIRMYLDGKNGAAHAKGTAIVDTTTIGSLKVPSIGIGTISWSSERMLALENLELQKLVDTACSSNAAFFDTAERYGSHIKTAMGLGYGETEKLLRLFMARSQTSSTALLAPVVATKFTPLPWRTTVESVVEACEQSCQRLGVDQIDLYQLHMPDIVQPFKAFGQEQNKDEIYWDGMAECYKRGLVKNIGVSNYGPTLLRKCQNRLATHGVPLASNQIAYSLIGRHNGAQETVDYCNQNGIQVLAFYPFAMGLLTGKYNADSLSSSSSSSSQIISLDTLSSLTKSKKSLLEELELKKYALGDGTDNKGMAPLLAVMQTVAERHGKTLAQVALNYIVCKGVIPIPGARSSAQLSDNIGAMGWRLSDDEVQLLETTADTLGLGFNGAGFKRTSEKFVGYGLEKWKLD